MPGGSAEGLVESARERLPELKVLILSSHAEASTIRPLMRAQISAYVLKDEAPGHLLQALKVVGGGATCFNQEVLTTFMEKPEEDQLLACLNRRETQVLRLVVEGKDNAAIAEEIFLAEQTVRNVVSSIYSKLEVSGSVELVVMTHDRALFDEKPSV